MGPYYASSARNAKLVSSMARHLLFAYASQFHASQVSQEYLHRRQDLDGDMKGIQYSRESTQRAA